MPRHNRTADLALPYITLHYKGKIQPCNDRAMIDHINH